MKSLHEMTPKELGKLFPVEITDYNKIWPKLYKLESKKIVKAVGESSIEKIHHIGSTSIKGLKAKPAIDVLLEVKSDANLDNLKESLTGIGYEATVQKDNPPPHMTFYKGYTVNGFFGQVFHLHIRYKGVQDEITFRDYLKKHPEFIKEYEELKLDLVGLYKFDRNGYTNAKTEFVCRILKEAKNENRTEKI